MAILNGYQTLAVLKVRLDMEIATTKWDETLEAIIEASSRWIDGYFKPRRGFTQFFAVTETRHYTPQFRDVVYVPDLLSVTSLKTDEDGSRSYDVTWLTTDFDLLPFNAIMGGQGRPFDRVELTPNGDQAFIPGFRRSVEIDGSWGFNTGASTDAPKTIVEACTLLSMRLFKRKDAIFGVAGVAALGVQVIQASIKADADIIALLNAIPEKFVP